MVKALRVFEENSLKMYLEVCEEKGIAPTKEYHGYLPQVFSKAMHGESAQNIAGYLREIETERMGLSGYNSNCLAIAEQIIKEKAKLGLE